MSSRYAIPMQTGNGPIPVFVGDRRQAGGNFFGTLSRFAMPLLKMLLPHLKNIGKRLGKSALNLGGQAVGDLVSGNARNIPENFKKRGRQELMDIGGDVINNITRQTGSGGYKRKHSVGSGHGKSSSSKRRKISHKKQKKKAINSRRSLYGKKSKQHSTKEFDIFSNA